MLAIMKSLTSNNLFLRDAFALSLKSLNFGPGLVPRAEQIVVRPTINADIAVSLSKNALEFSGYLQLKGKSLI